MENTYRFQSLIRIDKGNGLFAFPQIKKIGSSEGQMLANTVYYHNWKTRPVCLIHGVSLGETLSAAGGGRLMHQLQASEKAGELKFWPIYLWNHFPSFF